MKSYIIIIMAILSVLSTAAQATVFDACMCKVKSYVIPDNHIQLAVIDYSLYGFKLIKQEDGSRIKDYIIFTQPSVNTSEEEVYNLCNQAKQQLIDNDICPSNK